MLASSSNASEDAKQETLAAPPRIAFGENVDEKGAHQATGAGFPRVGTKELRRELTQDDKELAAAGYPISKKNPAEEKHVDIVRRRTPPPATAADTTPRRSNTTSRLKQFRRKWDPTSTSRSLLRVLD